eukprot:2078232-Alexandrium_andersonii.AAC.1
MSGAAERNPKVLWPKRSTSHWVLGGIRWPIARTGLPRACIAICTSGAAARNPLALWPRRSTSHR